MLGGSHIDASTGDKDLLQRCVEAWLHLPRGEPRRRLLHHRRVLAGGSRHSGVHAVRVGHVAGLLALQR